MLMFSTLAVQVILWFCCFSRRRRLASIAACTLRDKGLSIRAAADRVGHEADAAFSRAFRRQFGVAPGTYRERAQCKMGSSGSEKAPAVDHPRSWAQPSRRARVASAIAP
jgi:AraC-like DNA-binding protein